ncbi:hypothetical protein CN137_19300 [Sinorhizobium meliloti]|nr:hypothetical protein CN137_19300 [Sinorhizobium meliloti]
MFAGGGGKLDDSATLLQVARRTLARQALERVNCQLMPRQDTFGTFHQRGEHSQGERGLGWFRGRFILLWAPSAIALRVVQMMRRHRQRRIGI